MQIQKELYIKMLVILIYGGIIGDLIAFHFLFSSILIFFFSVVNECHLWNKIVIKVKKQFKPFSEELCYWKSSFLIEIPKDGHEGFFVRKDFLPSLKIFILYKVFREDFIVDFYVYIKFSYNLKRQKNSNKSVETQLFLQTFI